MENNGKKEQINLKENFLNKEILRSYIEFITKVNFTLDDEAEKITLYIKECLSELSKSNYFMKEFFDDSDNYFITQFIPIFIKKLANEKISTKSVKDNLWSIVHWYIDEMTRNFESQMLFEVWVAIIDFLKEEKTFNRSLDNDASDKFLVNFIINIIGSQV